MKASPTRLRPLPGDRMPFEPVLFEQAFVGVEKSYHVPARTVPVPEASVLPPNKAWGFLRGSTYTIPEDFVATLHDVLYCPMNNVIMTRPGQVLLESMNGPETFAKSLEPVRKSSAEAVQAIGGYCTLLNSNFNGYYHQLVENLPRILALNRPPYTDLDEIKLLCPRGLTETEDFFLSRLGPGNLRIVSPEPGRLYRLEHLLFTPFKTRQFAGYLPEAYVRQYQAGICPRRPPLRRHRILISRERSAKRHITNQPELMEALAPLGFEKYALEELSQQEQVELFYDAEVVVATHGAGLANLLFSPHVSVLELFPNGFVVPHYLFLCKALRHRYCYWCNDCSRAWDLQYLSHRVRSVPGVRRFLLQMGHRAKTGRTFDWSFRVDVPAVRALLAQMGIK